MKILMVNQHPQDVIGGSEIQCDLIATYLTHLGHEVVYLAVHGTSQQYGTLYPVEPVRTLGFGVFKRILQQHRPDIVYWRFNRRKFLQSMLACKLKQVKVVFAISSLSDLIKWAHRVNFDALSRWKKLRVGCSYAFLRHIITMRIQYMGYYLVDGGIAQLTQQTQSLPVRKEVVINNSVNDSITPFSWERPYIVWVGNFKAVKNPEIYIELARHFQNTGIDFLMVGDIRGSYKALVVQPDIPSNLHCLGKKPNHEVNGILRGSLFLVQTSYIEGFPNALIQAWKQAKPTVSLSYDPDRMIQKNRIGCVSGSVQQLTRDTETLIEDDTLRAEMGQRAKTFAETHFNPQENARKIEAFFREICEG